MDKKLTSNNSSDFPMSTPPPPPLASTTTATTTTTSSSLVDNLNQLDNLSNLIINNNYQRQQQQHQQQQQQYTSYLTADEHDNALLDKYEYDMSKVIQENYLSDKEQASQKLFQSFQTSACAVTQMFKDNTAASTTNTATTTIPTNTATNVSGEESSNSTNKPKAQSPQLTQWQSFQNSAGAITVLYKDSLEACKTHYDLGLVVGQHRKLKELITWIKKKKRRTIRKDELINFLIGNINNETTNLNDNTGIINTTNAVNNSNASLNKTLSISSNSSLNNTMNTQNNTSSMFFNTFSSSNTTTPGQHNNPFLNNNPFNSSKRMHNSVTNLGSLQHTQSIFGSGAVGLGHGNLAPSRLASNLNTSNNNSNNNNITNSTITNTTLSANTGVSNPIMPSSDTNSDLATFREALIMHNRSRDAPPNHLLANSQHHNANTHPQNYQNNQSVHTNQQQQQQQHQNHNHHHHHHHHQQHMSQNHHVNHHQASHPAHQQLPTPGSIGSTLNCDDLDCFFCEQIATHIEHKRSAANSNMNFDMGESPTRKRGRFV